VGRLVVRDEREQAVDAEAERLVAAILSFGILVLVMVRSLRGEAAWDLLALVIAAGFVGVAYRAWKRAVDRQLRLAGLVTGVVAAAVAVAAALAVALLTH
jgi:hypothetical protein